MDLAGRFTLVRRAPDKIIVRCLGTLIDRKLTQADVDHICGFYMVRPTEKWLQEATKDGISFELIIYTE